jgi:uncharacterized membrane protein
MTTSSNLTFMTTPTAVALSIVVVLLTAALGFYAWHRGGYRRAHGFQELLRVLIVILIAVLFNQPEWVEEYRPEERPKIVVLWDDSRSMETRDATPHGEGTRDVITRGELIQPLLEPDAWEGLSARFDVVIEPLSADESGTNLHDPLAGLPERTGNLRGIVLISDGDWNTGPPPVEAASVLRLKEIPVFTVAAGSSARLPDVELTSVDLPTFGIANKIVRVPFTIDSSLPREYATTVTLTTSSGETLTKDVRVAPMGRTSDYIAWKPLEEGDYTVTVEIPLHGDETITDNNARTVPIAIRQEKLKVLLVESYPRWEYRYLRNALSRDPGVEVSCLLFHPGLSKPGGGSADYIKQFPAGIEELAAYDVVFLGDVGLDDGQMTTEQCRLIKGLVEQQAGGLILMPGWQGRQLSLLETELADLYPVHLDPLQEGGWGSRTPALLELTERGRTSLLTKLAETQEENVQVWESLPGFQWYTAVTRAKAGTDVLAVHGSMSNEYGRLPLLVTRTFGAGKVLFMGTDGAWRWRKGVEDRYHYRFWGQVIRWMAYQRNMAKGETMRLFYTPEQPELGQTIALNAHVMESSGEPLAGGDVLARITSASGEIETVRFTSEDNEWGVFHAQFVPRESGQYHLRLSCRQTAASLETKFFVQGREVEQIGKPARPEVLEEIARVTGGSMVRPDEIDEIVHSMASRPLPPLSVRRLQLWSHPAAAAIVICLLAGFWIWRKTTGLI